MSALRVLAALACVAAVSCGQEPDGDAAHIVPERLTVSALPGGNGVLDVIALTLRQVGDHAAMYAALKNHGDKPACDPAFAVELFDNAQQSLAAGINGMLARSFYRRTDGSGAIASCVAPGDVAMAAITDLTSDVVIADVNTIVYHCPYFALDVEPIAGLEVHALHRLTRDGATVFAGTFLNQFDRTVSRAAVSVFPVNRVGRPLGMVSASDSNDVAPAKSWDFQTDPTDEPGVDGAAYPTAALPNQ